MNHVSQLSYPQRVTRFLYWAIIDVAIVITAHLIAFSARNFTIGVINRDGFLFIAFAAVLMIAILYLHNAYRIYWTRASGHNIIILVRSTFWATLILLIVDLLIQQRPVPISVLVVGMLLTFGGLVVVRYRSRLVGAVGWRWRAIWKREFPTSIYERVLIVGAGESGQMTAVRLKHHFRDANYSIIGFVDDDPAKQGMLIEGAQVLGGTKDIPEIARREQIDLIAVAIHNIQGTAFRHILQQCEQTTARVKVIPDILQMFNSRLSKTFLRDVQPEDIIGRTVVTQHEAVNLASIANRVVMITGAAGSIGSELSRQMLRYHNPTKIIILDNNESGLYDLQQELQSKYKSASIETVLVDVTHREAVNEAFARYRPAIVFHAAAYKHVPMLEDHPNEAVRVNIGGTLNLAQAAIDNHVERFVLISTDKAVNPSSVMGASKRICELIVHALGQQRHKTIFTAVRFGNVLGSRGSVVPLFNRQIDQGGPVTVTDKEMTRYFMSISEAVNLVIHAAALTEGHDIFVLKMGEVIRINDLAQRMIRLRGLRPYIDIPIEYTGVRPGEKLHEALNDDFEHLVDTIHPSIMKLNDWNLSMSGTEFLSSTVHLVQNGIPEDNQPLEALRTLCGFSQAFVPTETRF